MHVFADVAAGAGTHSLNNMDHTAVKPQGALRTSSLRAIWVREMQGWTLPQSNDVLGKQFPEILDISGSENVKLLASFCTGGPSGGPSKLQPPETLPLHSQTCSETKSP